MAGKVTTGLVESSGNLLLSFFDHEQQADCKKTRINCELFWHVTISFDCFATFLITHGLR